MIIEGKQCKLTTGIVIDRYKFLAFINNSASFFFLRWFFQFVCVGYYFSIKINKKKKKMKNEKKKSNGLDMFGCFLHNTSVTVI